MTEMNRANFARTMGVHRSRVTDWCSQGMPVLPDGNVDPVIAAEWVHRHIDPTARLRAARQTARNAPLRKAREIAPQACEHLTDPIDGAITAALPMLAMGVPAAAAALAVGAGASCAVAYALSKALEVAIRDDVAVLLDRLEVPPPSGIETWAKASLWGPDEGVQPNWPMLAAAAGEPVDLVAWDRHTRKRFGGEEAPYSVEPGKKAVSGTKRTGKR